MIAAAATAVGAASLWLWAEFVDWRASHRRLGADAGGGAAPSAGHQPAVDGHSTVRGHQAVGDSHSPGGDRALAVHAEGDHADCAPRTDAVVVLGYRNRGERANFVNRFRLRTGIRSLDPAPSTSLLILCGGAVGGETPEAIVMQNYARDELGFRGAIALDPDSCSTWENITNAIPHIDHADTIKIVSNGPHAEMGREILWQQRPDLAARLVRGEEHRFGEAPVLKILSALRIVQSRLTGSRVSRARAPR